MFLANFLIALREGTEATLIVGILVAYLTKVGRRNLLPAMWFGVALAAIVPLTLGAYMTWGPYTLTFQAQEIIGGTLSLVAVIMVTWMIFWMGTNATKLTSELESSAAKALESGSAWAIVSLAIISVGREGIETALMVWATIKSSAETAVMAPALGVVSGIAVSIGIGWLVYRGSAAINLRLFFNITGYLLILVAAGILCYGIGDFQEASVIPGWGIYLYDASNTIAPVASSPWFVLLNAFFNIKYLFSPTHVQFFGWGLYLLVVLMLFTRMITTRSQPAAASMSQPEIHLTSRPELIHY